MRIEVHFESGGFWALKPEWNDLVHRSCCDSVFLTWEWQSTWWKHLGEGDLLLLGFAPRAGRLVGIAPLFYVQDERSNGGARCGLPRCIRLFGSHRRGGAGGCRLSRLAGLFGRRGAGVGRVGPVQYPPGLADLCPAARVGRGARLPDRWWRSRMSVRSSNCRQPGTSI